MQFIFLPDSFALANDGSNIAARIAMIAITTSSSINVKPRLGRCFIPADIQMPLALKKLRAELPLLCHLGSPSSSFFPTASRQRNIGIPRARAGGGLLRLLLSPTYDSLTGSLRRFVFARIRGLLVRPIFRQKGSCQFRRFFREVLKGRRRNLQQNAIVVGYYIRRARPLIEQGNVSKEISYSEGRQNRLFAHHIDADSQLPLQNQIHRVARVSLLHNRGPLGGPFYFHELREPLQLFIAHPTENLHPPQRPRIDPADALDCDATRNSIRFRTKEHLKLGDLRRFLPGTGSCCENPRIRRDSLILDPRYQRWQLDRAIGRLVDTPDNKVCITRGHG